MSRRIYYGVEVNRDGRGWDLLRRFRTANPARAACEAGSVEERSGGLVRARPVKVNIETLDVDAACEVT